MFCRSDQSRRYLCRGRNRRSWWEPPETTDQSRHFARAVCLRLVLAQEGDPLLQWISRSIFEWFFSLTTEDFSESIDSREKESAEFLMSILMYKLRVVSCFALGMNVWVFKTYNLFGIENMGMRQCFIYLIEDELHL